MLFISRLVMIGLLGVGIAAATTAQAAPRLFTAEWYTKSFGNECAGTLTPMGAVAPNCGLGTGKSATYSDFAMPQGRLCNADNPRCPFQSTPVTIMGPNINFHPLGGEMTSTAPVCTPYTVFASLNNPATMRPPKGGTANVRVPPLFRNPYFFTSGGAPKVTACNATSTGKVPSYQTRFGLDRGWVQQGKPVTGGWSAEVSASGGFTFDAPGGVGGGIAVAQGIGEFENVFPYIYSYTYATLRNDAGVFGPGAGPGSFNIVYSQGTNKVASIKVTQGPAKFGGTMRMLGALTTKVCYWLQAGGGGCSLGSNNWRYEAIGATAMKSGGGMVTAGYIAPFTTTYYNTRNNATTMLNVYGARFPWTTGTVTLTARGRGPHKTVHYAHGYDNRSVDTSSAKGTIQLVTPVLTRWFGFTDFETGGIGILRIKFAPEPQTWAILIAGVSLLGVSYRLRGR